MRLIDADKIESHEQMDSFGGQYEPVMVAYMDDIDALPTVDAVPVRHGHWIGGEIGKCSVCGHKGCSSDIWNDGNVMFCPHCGARMDGDNERS